MSAKRLQVLSARYPDDEAKDFQHEEVSSCPLCHYGIVPFPVYGCFVAGNSEDRYQVYLLYLCPHCQRIFMAKYSAYTIGELLCSSSDAKLSPCNAKLYEFPQSIQDVSPLFVETFNQSAVAEAQDLTQIAGCGYRRAVEYLVKDYLCHKLPDQEEQIKSEFLGSAIKRISDPRVKTLAERSVWIGNDETHYIKKHEALDIADMKRFIGAMLHYIEAELSFEEALSIPPA